MRLQDGSGHQLRYIKHIRLFLLMEDLDRKHFPLAREDRALQGRFQGFRINCCRHHDHAHVLAQELAALPDQRERLVGVEAPLVKLVEDHHRHLFQRRVIEEHTREHPFGDHLDTRLLRHAALEADAVAHCLAHRLLQQPRHARRDLSCCHPSRFQDNYFSCALRESLQQHQRQHRRLTRTRCRRHYRRRSLLQGLVERFCNGRHGQRGQPPLQSFRQEIHFYCAMSR